MTLNVAMTADGKIDTVERGGAGISSAGDWARVDRLRAESDAVIVGGRTLLDEDPRLTVKSAELRAQRLGRGGDENPIKVGIVSEAALGPESKFLSEGPARVLIFTTERSTPEQIEGLRGRGAEVFVAGEGRVDLEAVLETLREQGVARALVEGGGTLNSELLRRKLVDEIYLYMAPLIFGGSDAPTLADGAGLSRDEALELQLESVEAVEDGGIIVHYTVR